MKTKANLALYIFTQVIMFGPGIMRTHYYFSIPYSALLTRMFHTNGPNVERAISKTSLQNATNLCGQECVEYKVHVCGCNEGD